MAQVNEWQRHKDEELMAFLTTSFLVEERGYTLQEAAECYDDMNDNTELQDCLARQEAQDE